MAGLTLEGFVTKSLDECLGDLQEGLRTGVSQNLKLDDESAVGAMTGVMATQIASLWELAEQVYHAPYLYGGSGQSLDDTLALGGGARDGAAPSIVTLLLGGTPATIIPTGKIARVPGGVQFELLETAILDGAGADSVLAQATIDGPEVATAGTITEIVTAVAGWNTVTNPLDATIGRNAETDTQARLTFLEEFEGGGGSSDDAVKAALLRLRDDGVSAVLVVSNRSAGTDSEGRPPHSIEAIVKGGSDQAVLDALWVAAPGGIQFHGNFGGTVIDLVGDAQAVRASRFNPALAYVVVEYTPNEEAADDIEDSISAEVLAFGSALRPGKSVFPWQVEQNIETTGLDYLRIRVGLAANPSGYAPLIIPRTSEALFDSTRIAFEVI